MNDGRSGYIAASPEAGGDVLAPGDAIASPPAQREPLTHGERRFIAMGMMVPVFVGSVDQSILATSLPTIGRALGDVHDLPWLITAYLIAATALTPLYGKFADIRGRRAALSIALGVYMTGALISASSSTMLMLICGRVVQGCGGGGLISTAQIILGDIAAPKDRGKYYAYFSIAFTTAAACGPALGGWICDHLDWRVIFLWNIPLTIASVILAITVLRRLPRYDRPHRLDFVGAILIMAASSSFMLALNLGGVRFPWLSAPVLGFLAAAFLLGVGFVVRLLTTVEPLIPVAILADAVARVAIVANCFSWGALIGLNVFLPIYLQSALGWSATASGLSVMVLMVAFNASAGLSSQLIGRVKHYKILPGFCLLVAIAAVLALAYSTGVMTPIKFEIILFLIGIGLGPTAPLTQVVLQNTVATSHLGAAIGTMNFTRVLGGTILVAVFGAIVLTGVQATTAGVGHGLAGTSVKAFSQIFFAAAGTLTVAFLAMLVLEEKPLQATMPAARA
ncbi:MAG TPA: MFS transporter [Xanthobacteraceae bacterium]|nr:MFS transporter [Xanthobacteraceae bacterium]